MPSLIPPSPVRWLPLLAALALLPGCGKPSDSAPPPASHAAATPSPTPALVSDRTQRRAASALSAVDNYLKTEDPKLREKIQKAADKFTHDKDKWRERLKNKQHEIQPQIAKLRQQLAGSGNTGDALRRLQEQLAGLESQNRDTDKKLSDLENATGDAWKTFREQLKNEENASPSPSPTAEGTPR